jgi:hypothetical protein
MMAHRFIAATYPCLGFCIITAGAAGALFPHWTGAILGALAVIAALDVRARWRDYRRLVPLFRWREDPDTFNDADAVRLLRRHRHSWCQRTAAIAAWRGAGNGEFAAWFYRHLGYRWWHVLPDGTFSRRSPYLNPAFYRALIFGTKEAA